MDNQILLRDQNDRVHEYITFVKKSQFALVLICKASRLHRLFLVYLSLFILIISVCILDDSTNNRVASGHIFYNPAGVLSKMVHNPIGT